MSFILPFQVEIVQFEIDIEFICNIVYCCMGRIDV